MKRRDLIIAIIFFVVISSNLNYCKIWQVDLNTANNPDFTDPQAAVNDTRVTGGDTIYLAGNPGNYGNLTLDKKITLIGNGFFKWRIILDMKTYFLHEFPNSR